MLNPPLVRFVDNNVPGFIRKFLQAILHRLMNTSGRILFVMVRFEALVTSKTSRNFYDLNSKLELRLVSFWSRSDKEQVLIG